MVAAVCMWITQPTSRLAWCTAPWMKKQATFTSGDWSLNGRCMSTSTSEDAVISWNISP